MKEQPNWDGVCTIDAFARMSGLRKATAPSADRRRLSVVLLGAGASYCSDQDTSAVSPLARDLLEELRRFAPDTWGVIPLSYSREFSHDFERGFEKYVLLDKPNLFPLAMDIGRFFFQFAPSSSNLHLSLARNLIGSDIPVFIASLNYDRFMELSLNQCGISQFGDFRSPVTMHPWFPVCYPHGCCHLCYPSNNLKLTDVKQYGFGEFMDVSGSLVIRHGERGDIEYNSPAVMSLFERDKRTIIGADFVDQERMRLARAIERADNVAIIGIQVRLHDQHLWRPLTKTKARLIYCSGTSAAKGFQQWSKHCRTNDHDVVLSGYFRENYERIASLLGVK